MKNRLLVPCAAIAGLFITACNKQEAAPEAPPAKKATAAAKTPPAVLPAGPTEAEKELKQQIRQMETREAELRLQLEEQRLAATEAEIAKERDLMEKEREAWRLEQELADARASLPLPGAKTLVSAAATPVSLSSRGYDYQMFYDDLAPLGSWFDSEEYGYVWQPSTCVYDTSWRPYTRGRWASSDQGWTWCSEEPFGWACYHYGRWAKIRRIGWVWVPGDQWAPSWVAWRKSDKYVGWCPLPPETVYDRDCTYGDTIDRDCGIDPGCYVFVPVTHFDEPVLSYCEPPPVCITICRTTVNITRIIIRPGRVECPGPRHDWIRDCVRRPVPRYTLACDSERREPGHGRGHRVENNRLLCFTPRVRAPWNTDLRPARTAATIAGAEVVRAKGGLPDRLVVRFKQEKQHREQAAQNPAGASGKNLSERQQRLASLEKTREALQEKLRLETAAAKASVQPEPKLAGRPERGEKVAARPDSPGPQSGEGGRPKENKRGPSANRPDSVIAGTSGESPAAATPPKGARPSTPPVSSPAPVAPATTPENPRLTAAREELAKLRAQREAQQPVAGTQQPPTTDSPPAERETAPGKTGKPGIATRTREESARRQQEEEQKDPANDQAAVERAAMEKQRRDAAVAASNDAAARESEKQNNARAAALEERRRQLEAQKEQAAQERAAMEKQRRDATTAAANNEAAARDSENQNNARAAALEERRRQLEAQKEQAAQERAAMEKQRRDAATAAANNDAAARDSENQNNARNAAEARRQQQQQQQEAQNQAAKEQAVRERAAMEQQRRQAEADARAEQQARQREAMEQQRRQAEADARAEQQARQREAVEQQRRQAEADARAEQQARQREAMEQQRRQAEADARADQQRRQAEEQNRRAEEQSRRQAEEQNRRQAEEQSRRQAEEQRARADSENRNPKDRR